MQTTSPPVRWMPMNGMTSSAISAWPRMFTSTACNLSAADTEVDPLRPCSLFCVNQDVDLADLICDPDQDVPHGRSIGDVHMGKQATCAEGLDIEVDLVGRSAIVGVSDRHRLRARPCQGLGDRPAARLPSARDQADLIADREVGVVSPIGTGAG